MATGEVCERCGRRVAMTLHGLCGYCAHATTTDAQRARQTLVGEGALSAPVTWSESELAHLTFYRNVWAQLPVEAR